MSGVATANAFGAATPRKVHDDETSSPSRETRALPGDPATRAARWSLSPGSDAADNILRRCAPPEIRDLDPSLPSLHKSRNDAMPLLPHRVFAFRNDDVVRSRRGGGGRRG